jgi:hypothetical protein
MRRERAMITRSTRPLKLYQGGETCYRCPGFPMINYILLYKIKKKVKSLIKDKIAMGEIATTPSSCLDCLATDLSWEIYYIIKEKDEA